MKLNFDNKNVLIFGGSKGIGFGVVKALAELGATVYYASRTEKFYKHAKVHFVKTDVQDHKQITAVFDQFENKTLDVLVNCTGINFAKQHSEITMQEWQQVIDVNLSSYFLTCKLALEKMIPNRKGKIVNVSSIAGKHRSVISGCHYVASKAGILGLTRQLAYETAKHNINVNAVCPSQTKTEMLTGTMDAEQILALEKNIPLGRIAEVEEQVGPILFLCSELSNYITGTCLDVNGGQI